MRIAEMEGCMRICECWEYLKKERGSGIYNGESRVVVMETFHSLIPLGILMDLVQEKMGSTPPDELLCKVGK